MYLAAMWKKNNALYAPSSVVEYIRHRRVREIDFPSKKLHGGPNLFPSTGELHMVQVVEVRYIPFLTSLDT